ncbi:GNAT family N-acetyltransferase [Flavobacteriaceae bacterium R38]|nr:GNAT family N-acetyltransferase [Flavobacteriaceae bacterium R38]
MTIINKAETNADFQQIAGLAKIIWSEHYTPIIGAQQVEYMLEKFQSATAIEEQIQQGAAYFLLHFQDKPAGYFSYFKEKDTLFLSKLYVLSTLRGNRIGKKAISFIEDKAKELNCDSITLTVNKYNTNSIKAYEKMGFKNMGATVKDIGEGYIMDDFLMKKDLSTPK